MTHDEMITIIEHHKNGGEVEYRRKFLNDANLWKIAQNPIWNFDIYEYRKKETLKTKTVWFWKVKSNSGLWYIRNYMCTEEEIKKEWGDALEFKRMDILGSEEVPNE